MTALIRPVDRGLLGRAPGLRFILSRMSRQAALTVLAATLISLVLQGRDVAVPLIPGDAVVRTSALLPLLISVPLVAMCANSMQVLEATVAGRRLTLSRLAWALTLGVSCGGLSALSAWGGDPEGISPCGAALNAACFVGVGLISAAAMGADLAWTGPCLLALTTFFFGKDLDNQVRSWAWMLHEPGRVDSWSVSIGLFLAGTASYTCLDSTGQIRRWAGVR